MAGRWLALGVLIGLLAGCVGDDDSAQLRDSGDYTAGYSDGCRTAGSRGAQLPGRATRDKALAETSEGYRAGWSAGFASCGGVNDPLNR